MIAAFRAEEASLDREVLAVHGSGKSRCYTGRQFWSLVRCCAERIERDLPDARFLLVIGRSSALSMAAFLGAIVARRLVAFFPPISPRQDRDAYLRQHRSALGLIGAHAIIVESDALLAGLESEAGFGGAPVITLESVEDEAADAMHARETLDAFRAELQRQPSGEPLFVQHSSGTIGIKKAVEITREALLAQYESYWPMVERLTAPDAPRIASWLPLYHDMGLIAAFVLPVLSGARISMIDPFDWVEDPVSLFRMIKADRCTVAWLPNFAFRHMVRLRKFAEGVDLSSMRAWIDCSEPCRVREARDFEAAFAEHGVATGSTIACYAMAETVFAVLQGGLGMRRGLRAPAHLSPGDDVLAAGGMLVDDAAEHEPGERAYLGCGAPIPGIEVRITIDGAPAQREGIYGEIAVRGPALFGGYRNRGRTESMIDDEGFYVTGDLGAVIGGELFVFGRAKELIIVNGKNIYASDIEEMLNRMDGVKPGRVVAFGLANARLAARSWWSWPNATARVNSLRKGCAGR